MDDVPALGAHSRSILAELGYDAPAVEALGAAGAISSS
jgi:crotonobetainyl-CoA:carnitine CoA-transferase CaiB-like acyl-CoA transferase